MPQPSHSSDLAPADIFLFPKLKTPMKGKCFARIEEIKEKLKLELLAILKLHFELIVSEFLATTVFTGLATIEEIKEKSIENSFAIPKSAFRRCLEDWKKRRHKFIIPELL